MGRRARACARPGRVVPLRMVVRHAPGCRPAAARPHPGRARRGDDPQGRDPVQRPVDRVAPDLHRHRIVHRLRARRPVGRLSAVLRDVPLPAPAPGLPERAVPSLAARPPRRDHGRRVPLAALRPRLPALRGAGPCLPAGEGAGPLRSPKRGRRGGAAGGRLRRRAHPEQRRPPPPHGGGAALDAAAVDLVRLPADADLRRRRPRAEGRVRRARDRRPPGGGWRGTSAATPGSTPGWRPTAPTTCWPSTPIT